MKTKQTDKKRKIKDVGEVAYISKKAFKKIYPMENVGYSILGFIGEGVADPIGEWEYENEMHSYYSFKKKRMYYEIIGYIEVSEDTYITIMKKKRLKLLLLFLMFLALVGSLMFYFMQPKGPDLEEGMGEYDPKTSISENKNPDRILLPGYKNVNMEADTDLAYLALYNPKGNPCYFKYRIILSDTNETIYQSKLIPPGFAVTAVKFNQTFPSGVHPITIKVETFALDDYTVGLNGGDIPTRIVAIDK